MNQPSHRSSSILSREKRPDGVVYVKRYTQGDWDRTKSVVAARTEREIALLRELRACGRFRASLGVLELVEGDPAQALLVTREVGGEPLEVALEAEFRRHFSRECLRALYLAGKWLQRFQSLPTRAEDQVPISSYDPSDLVEYCELRMDKLRECNYPWPSDGMRSRLLETLQRMVRDVPQKEKRLVWTHGDYAPGNVLWDGRILTPIDFGMAHADWPLADVTYFIHRLDMLQVYRPWLPWPLRTWKRAFLRGYGRPDAEMSAAFRVLMVRHHLCRLLTYVWRPPRDLRQAIHDRWVRWCVRRSLKKALERW